MVSVQINYESLRIVDVLHVIVMRFKQQTTRRTFCLIQRNVSFYPFGFHTALSLRPASSLSLLLYIRSFLASNNKERIWNDFFVHVRCSSRSTTVRLEGKVNISSRGYIIKSFSQSAYFLSLLSPLWAFLTLILGFFSPYFPHKNMYTPNHCP